MSTIVRPDLSPEAIRRNVLDELRWSTRVDGAELRVDVDGGVVALRGTAPSLAAALAATEIVGSVPGVAAVVDDVDVVVPHEHHCDDVVLAKKALRALEDDARIVSDTLQLSVADGVLRIAGTVPSWAALDDVVRCLAGVRGARGLISSLVVRAPHAVDVDDLHRAIERALDRHAEHTAKHVRATVDGDTVTLTGKVRSRAERDAIVGAVRGTRGVAHIDDSIEIGR